MLADANLGILDIVVAWIGVNVNLVVVGVYLALMLALGLYLARYVQKDSDYFLAGRSLNKWIIAGTVMATNVAAIYLVGPAGAAFGTGVPVLLIAWTGNMIAALSALLFVPRLRRLGITTVSEFLEQRYGVGARLITSIWWILFYSLFAGNAMYALSTVLEPVLQVDFRVIILFVFGGVILYCMISGLLAVVYSDVIQAFLIIVGGLILLPLAIKAVGGMDAFVAKVPERQFVFWKTNSGWPAPGDIIMFIILGLPYWCTSQYMLQRSFAGRTVRDASRGLILAALITGPITLAYILPAMAAPEILQGTDAIANIQAKSDLVLPELFLKIMPLGLGGLFVAALVAASNSTVSSLLNSMATLGESDIYRRFVRKRSSRHYMWIGRVLTLAGGCLGLLFAYNVNRFGGIVQANSTIMSVFEPPIFIIAAAALLWRRSNLFGALTTAAVWLVFNAIVLDQPFLEMFGLAPWAAIREAIGLTGTTLSMSSRAMFGFPVFAVAMVGGSLLGLCFKGHREARQQRTAELFQRMQAPKRVEPVARWRYWGLVLSVLALGAFVYFAFNEKDLIDCVGKGTNVLVYLGMVSAFVFGCLIAVPIFVEHQEVSVEVRDAAITRSLTNRILGSGWSWLILGVLAVTLMVWLYVVTPAGGTGGAVEPATKPAETQPVSQPATQAVSQPASAPATQADSQPASAPATQADTQPATAPATQPTSGPATQPTTAPSTQPTTQPATQPVTQPSTRPA